MAARTHKKQDPALTAALGLLKDLRDGDQTARLDPNDAREILAHVWDLRSNASRFRKARDAAVKRGIELQIAYRMLRDAMTIVRAAMPRDRNNKDRHDRQHP